MRHLCIYLSVFWNIGYNYNSFEQKKISFWFLLQLDPIWVVLNWAKRMSKNVEQHIVSGQKTQSG